MNKVVVLSAVALVTLNFSLGANAEQILPGGVSVKPSVYSIALSAIEFKTTGGSFISYHSGQSNFDMASVDAGTQVGSYGEGSSLSAGSYAGVRFTIGRHMTVIATGTDDEGQLCHTAAGLGTTVYEGMTVARGSTDPNVATTAEQILIPNNPEVDSQLENEDDLETLPNGQLRGTLNFTNGAVVITKDDLNPKIKMSFNVDNSVEIKASGPGSCVIVPNAPSITAQKV